MPSPSIPCCVASLNQQREQAVEHHKVEHQKQCSDGTIAPCQSTAKMYTTIENGKVVVKPILTRSESDK